mgnify:CR=1 FL=1
MAPSRADVARATVSVLSRGGRWNPDVMLVEGASGPVVVKDFRPRGRLVAATLGRWLCAREMRAYRRLDGLPVVPRLLGRVDDCAFALEYRPGVALSRSLRGRLPEGFVGELLAGVRAMHRRGVVHLDLRHRSNVLAGEDQRPVIVDLGSALCFDPEGRLGRWLVRWLGLLDRRAVEKWRVRVEPSGDEAPRGQPSPPASAGPAPAAGTASAGSRGRSRPM